MNFTVECMFALSLLLRIGLEPFYFIFSFLSPFKKKKKKNPEVHQFLTLKLKNKVRLFLLCL